MKAHRVEYRVISVCDVRKLYYAAYDLGDACVEYFRHSGRTLNLVDNILVGEVNYYLIRSEVERCDCYPHIYWE